MKKKASVCVLALIMGLCLGGCTILLNRGPGQEAADNSVEAVDHFLTSLQSGDYEQAKTYLREGNRLSYVFDAMQSESIPELDEVYRGFCGQMSDLTFTAAEDTESQNEFHYGVTVTAQNRDYGSAINAAMLEALQKQCEEGGSSFVDYAGWMSRGVTNAAAGEEGTAWTYTSPDNGVYTLDHRGYLDEKFFNLITGGFYEFADVTMTTCTSQIDDVQYTDYIVSLGDKIVASLKETATPMEGSGMTEEDVAALREFYRPLSGAQKGIYYGVYARDGWCVYAVGIDYETANDTALVNAGIVSGEYQGNITPGYLSLRQTIHEFESTGAVCVTVPQYDVKEHEISGFLTQKS